MKFVVISLIIHSFLFLVFVPNINEKIVKNNKKEHKINIKIKNIIEKEKKKDKNVDFFANNNSSGEKDDPRIVQGIQYIDSNSIRLKYFSFYLRAKNIVDYRWKKSLTKYYPKSQVISVFFELSQSGIVKNVLVMSNDIEYKNNILDEFNKLVINDPPKDLFINSDTMFLRWVFETN